VVSLTSYMNRVGSRQAGDRGKVATQRSERGKEKEEKKGGYSAVTASSLKWPVSHSSRFSLYLGQGSVYFLFLLPFPFVREVSS
jgi:hypothetical protein